MESYCGMFNNSPTQPNVPASPHNSVSLNSQSSAHSNLPQIGGSNLPILQRSSQAQRPSGNETRCDTCDKPWVPDRSDPTEVFYPDEEHVLPYKCPACCKKTYGGVSYVVESESKQIGASAASQPLAHIVYQPKNLRCQPSQFLTRCFHKVIREGEAYMAILPGETYGEQNNVREYLLFPERRKDYLHPDNCRILKGLDQLQHEMLDKRMIVLHYKYHEDFVLLPCLVKTGDQDGNYDAIKSIEESDIQIGMLIRKGTNKDHGPSLNVRLDLFVKAKGLWYNLLTSRRNELKYIQQLVEDHLMVCFRKWNDLSRPKTEATSPTTPTTTSTSPTSSSPPQSSSPPLITPLPAITTTTITTPTKKSPIPGFLPLFLVSIRDIFKIELIPVISEVVLAPPPSKGLGPQHVVSRKCTKTEWYFPRDNLPNNYVPSAVPRPELPGEPAGVTQYNGFYTEEELQEIERQADMTDNEAKTGGYDDVPLTHQSSKKGARVSRTKFFFSARYLWTKEQMDEPDSSLAEGIRADVAAPPNWMKNLITKPLVSSQIIPEDYVNEYAMNIYHDGTEGLGQHYDDKKRFQRPIYSLRIYSDCRLAFGSKDFAMVNSMFFVPMARGCITILERDGYAADGIKHCIRASDMTGKSGVVLLRQIHPHVMAEAKHMYHVEWLTRWLESIHGLENPKQYVQAFIEEEINVPALCALNECDLKALGFVKMGPRKLVMTHIEQLKEKLTGKPTHPHMSCCCNCVSHLEGCKYEKENLNEQQQNMMVAQQQQQHHQLELSAPLKSSWDKQMNSKMTNYTPSTNIFHGAVLQQQQQPQQQLLEDMKFVAEEVLEQGTTPMRGTTSVPSIFSGASTPSPAKGRGRPRGALNKATLSAQASAAAATAAAGVATINTPPAGNKRRADTTLNSKQSASKRPTTASASSSSPTSSSSTASSSSSSTGNGASILGMNAYSPFSLSSSTTTSPPSSLFNFSSSPTLSSPPVSPPTSTTATTTTTPTTTPTTPATTTGPSDGAASVSSFSSELPQFQSTLSSWPTITASEYIRSKPATPAAKPDYKATMNQLLAQATSSKSFQSSQPRQPLAPLVQNN